MGRWRVRLAVVGAVVAALLLTPKDIPYDNAGIAFIGDSLTLGSDASSLSKTFFRLVTHDLDQRGVQEDARLFISADPRFDLSAASQAAKRDRDVIIIELGIHAALDDAVTADDFRVLYSTLLNCVVGDDTIVVAGTVPWLGWDPGSDSYARAEQFSQIIVEEAARKQVAVADLWSATNLHAELISTPADHSFLPPYRGDNFHPNDVGHAVIAQVYENALAGELANPPERTYGRACH
ncbi:MAG: SGNH/GDSL hydrolase family protein [Dehalococcoidia bacterium]|jgi:hypothetical protein